MTQGVRKIFHLKMHFSPASCKLHMQPAVPKITLYFLRLLVYIFVRLHLSHVQ